MKTTGKILSTLTIVAAAWCLTGADSGPQNIPIADLNGKVTLIGQLGKPLGTYMNIEGTPHTQSVKMGDPFDVDTVDGVKLPAPVLIEIRGVKNIPPGTRCVFRGYETGTMGSTPQDPLHPDFPGAQGAYRFYNWFVLTQTIQPATTERAQ